ncbi:MAG TPA: ATP-binding protein [Gallionella sp.]|nr:ATP-binding protein [Gallionella sp.]
MDDQTDFHRMADALNGNARDLSADLEWLAQSLQTRLTDYFATPSRSPLLPLEMLPPPDLALSDSPYAAFTRKHGLSAAERLVLLLALAPTLRPQLLDILLTRNESTQRGFTEFGGIQASASAAFLPTVETACFLLAGDDLAGRMTAMQLLSRAQAPGHTGIIDLIPASPAESFFTAALQPSRRVLELILQSRNHDAALQANLPAQRMLTQLDWNDLVLPANTLEQLDEIRVWLTHGSVLLHEWGMSSKLRAGYTSLFHGPPGTGKTLAASLLGKLCGCEVYKIDLSMVVSKYIGETEKNLARIFDQAEGHGWILFFDEADALFGKRTRVDNAHDRYANQEVSFLLQRIEEYSGVAILASNLKNNIDDAFLRRFQSVIHFPLPRAPERLRIWREAFPGKASLEDGLDLSRIAEQHELSGGAIVNVVRFASLKALARGDHVIRTRDVDDGIQRELLKEGRAF